MSPHSKVETSRASGSARPVHEGKLRDLAGKSFDSKFIGHIMAGNSAFRPGHGSRGERTLDGLSGGTLSGKKVDIG